MADSAQCTMAAAVAIMHGTIAILALEEVARTADDDTAEALRKVAEALAMQNHAMGLLLARIDELERRWWFW